MITRNGLKESRKLLRNSVEARFHVPSIFERLVKSCVDLLSMLSMAWATFTRAST